MLNLVATPLFPRFVHISWQPLLNEEQIGPILDYQIILFVLGRNSPPDTVTTSSTSIVIGLLYPGSYYQCSVASRTNGGQQNSTDIVFQLPPDGKRNVLHICTP